MKKVYLLALMTALLVFGAAKGQIPLTSIEVAYEQNFNTLQSSAALHDFSTLPSGWLFFETGTNANTTYGVSSGTSTAGNTYSFGTDASDRAMGTLFSNSLNPAMGAAFINQTGTVINSLHISYTGEHWRLGAADRFDRLDFEYSTNATALNNGTWTSFDAGDFQAPSSTGGPTLNGNVDPNRVFISFNIAGLNIPNGSTFFIRWVDFNATSSDDGLAIDDFSLTASGTPPDAPAMSFTPSVVEFQEVTVGTSVTQTYQVTGANLTQPISIFVASADYRVSTDNVNFGLFAQIPASGGTVWLRFTPADDGVTNAIITHVSGSLFRDLEARGAGFVQTENIITIAEARTKTPGTRVTVAGRVTVADQHGSPSFIQDATGGIPVFDFSLSDAVSIGDSVIVTGPISFFFEQVQISGSGLIHTIVPGAPRLIEPAPIQLSQLADYEGQLVTVQNVELVNKNFVFYPQSTEKLTDGSVQGDLRIDGDTDIPGLAKPQTSVSITGVVGRFNANAQLLPRFQPDIPGADEPSTPSDTIPKSKTLDVVTWNLEFFGARKEDYPTEDEFGPADEQLQLENVKEVLTSLQADIIAVEEVSDEAFFAQLVSQLPGYDYTCSQRYSYSFQGPSTTFPPQKVCFIYDVSVVEVVSARPMFEQLYDAARNGNPSLLPGIPDGDASSFYSSGRLPYQLKVKATINGLTEDISLIGIHAKSGSGANDRLRRLYDATVLKDSLDAHAAADKVIILGDLNDDLDVSISGGQSSPYQAFVTDADYDPITKALSDAGGRSTTGFQDVIDHQIITSELQEDYIEGSAQIIAPFRLVANYAATTSDHLPVITRYAFSEQSAIAGFVGSTAQVSENGSQVTLQIELDKPAAAGSELKISVQGTAVYGGDFQSAPAAANGVITLQFAGGETSATVVVTTIDDKADEVEESAIFTLLEGPGFKVGDASVFTVTITDNDIAKIYFAELLAAEEEGSGPYRVKLKLTTPVATDETVTLALYTRNHTDYGVDYTTSPAAVNDYITLPVPAGSSVVEFTITPLADKKKEIPWELVSFHMESTSDGLWPTGARLFIFTIIDARKKPHFVLYPNPVRHIVRLLCEELDDDAEVHLELRGTRGEKMLKAKGSLDRLSDLLSDKMEHARKGVYTVNVSVDGETYMLRLVKTD